MSDFLQVPWVQRSIFVVGGVILGLLAEAVLVDRVRAMVARTRFQWDDLIVNAFRGLPTVWLSAAGVYLALSVGTVQAAVATPVRSGLTVLLIGSVATAGTRAVGDGVRILSAGKPGTIKSPTASSIVKNFSFPETALWVSIPVGVAYDSDLDHLERVTFDVAREVTELVDGGVKDEAPKVIFREFGDSSINLEVRLRVGEFRSQGPIRHEFIKRLHRRYNQEGIEIPFPIRTVVMKGATST